LLDQAVEPFGELLVEKLGTGHGGRRVGIALQT